MSDIFAVGISVMEMHFVGSGRFFSVQANGFVSEPLQWFVSDWDYMRNIILNVLQLTCLL